MVEELRELKPHVWKTVRMGDGNLSAVEVPVEAWDALLDVAEAYRDLHSQTCDDYWSEDECACGGRQLLARLQVQLPPAQGAERPYGGTATQTSADDYGGRSPGQEGYDPPQGAEQRPETGAGA